MWSRSTAPANQAAGRGCGLMLMEEPLGFAPQVPAAWKKVTDVLYFAQESMPYARCAQTEYW